MAIRKLESGRWEVNIKPGGRTGRQVRKLFKTRADAAQFEQWALGQAHNQPEWKPEKRDQRRLSDLIELWWKAHGKQLSAAEDTHRRLKAICQALGNPAAPQITAAAFANYRTQRIAGGLSASTANRELAYVRAMFNTLASLDQWKKENPVGNVKAFRVQETELAYLTADRVCRLLDETAKARNPHVDLITRACLATGARWSEVERLRISQVRDDHLHLVKTKSKKTRNVPIEEELAEQLRNHHQGPGERIFEYAEAAFREAIERAEIDLPEGQMTHVLRHTFASCFMQNGGNILALQKILGHADLKTTMRYAHLAPKHLAEAKKLNPLKMLASGEWK